MRATQVRCAVMCQGRWGAIAHTLVPTKAVPMHDRHCIELLLRPTPNSTEQHLSEAVAWLAQQ